MADLPKKAHCDLIRRNVVRKEREFFKDLGEKPFRADQVMKWMYHYCSDDFDDMTDINKVLRKEFVRFTRLHPL